MPQTLDQKRAEYAWNAVTGVAMDLLSDRNNESAVRKGKKLVSDYTSAAKGLPTLIMTSGLMQTLAFLQAKMEQTKPLKEQQHVLLLVDLMCWVGPVLTAPVARVPTNHDEVITAFRAFMEKLHKDTDSRMYRRATDESLALLRWIRQFADARKAMEG